jgi:HEAT repeat protein
MTLARAAAVALAALMAAALLFGAATVLGRVTKRQLTARRARLAAPARRLLVRLTAGDDADDGGETLLDQLVAVDQRTWNAVEPAAVGMLGKVRGEAHTSLVTVFKRRGAGDRALKELTARSPVARARAAEVLGNLGDPASVPALCTLLRDRDPDVRVVAARSLGRIADPAAAIPLLDSLDGRNAVPPQIAAHALVRLGLGAQAAFSAGMLHHSELVRATALEVLGLIGAVGAAKQVEFALRSDLSLEVRVRAARTLGRLGPRSALAPLLEAVEPGHAKQLRAEAAKALGELGAPAAAQPLAALLADGEYEVAHESARALLKLGVAGRTELEKAVDEGDDEPLNAETPGGHAREALSAAHLTELRKDAMTGTVR